MSENIKQEMQITAQELESQGLILPRNIADKVINSLTTYENSGTLIFPKDYSVGNAIKSAWIKIQNDSKLMVCDDTSKANAMLDMAILGLSPAKQQCYLVPMGNKVTLLPSYFGKQCAVKRIKGVIDVRSDVIYKGTEYTLDIDDYGNDTITITKPCPLEERKSENIVGAWAKLILDENVFTSNVYTSIMTIQDIENAWNMGNAKGKSPAHLNFRNEMSRKSAINRCIKNFVNSHGDQDLIIETLNRTTENDYQNLEEQSQVFENQEIDIDGAIDTDFEVREETTSSEVEPTLFVQP